MPESTPTAETSYDDKSWAYIQAKEWQSPPAPLDQPLQRILAIGASSAVSGVVAGHPEQSVNLVKDIRATPHVNLRAKFSLQVARESLDREKRYRLVEKIFVVSLQDTIIVPRPGTDHPQSQDAPDRTGWYVDQLDVEMGFESEAAVPVLVSSAPGTGSLSGSVNSSVARSLNVGFFGDMLTAAYSQSWSSSFSYSLQDFAMMNNSDEKTVRQSLQMKMSKGAPYDKPADLIDGRASVWHKHYLGTIESLEEQLGTLRGLPEKAISTMTLPTQGIWVVPGETRDKLVFQIKITPRFVHHMSREKTWQEMSPEEQARFEMMHSVGIDPRRMVQVKFIDTDVESPSLTWKVEVDFSSVGPRALA